MIASRNSSTMSGFIGHARQSHHPSPQDYRLLTMDSPQLSKDELPSDLQSLSWLTSVDLPRLQQITTGHLDLSTYSHGALLGQHTAQLTMSGGQAAMIHLQSNVQSSLLGATSISSHSTNMAHYSLNGQHSPGFHSPPAVYQASPQQGFTLGQNSQQCSTAGLYSSSSFNNQSHYSQSQISLHSNSDLQPKSFPKPIYSYSCLIAMALKNSKTGSLPVSEIYSFMKEHFPYFKTAPDGWKNSVRHNLSLNKCFEKVENKLSGSSRKGCLWALNPAKIDKMEEEMQKWKRKDLSAIRRSMANPDELDKLITDRPESCRRKTCDSGVTRMSSCPSGLALTVQLHPQPVMNLSLQGLPLHHQVQAQAQAQAQTQLVSSNPLQTPPHSGPEHSHSPVTQNPGKPTHDCYSLIVDASNEVDVLDSSLMDFALQGNLWEEMKDESFSLETLGAFSSSPLQMSDCELGVPGLTSISNSPSFSDLQVTGLYSTYAAMDSVSSQYLSTQGGKPIALL